MIEITVARTKITLRNSRINPCVTELNVNSPNNEFFSEYSMIFISLNGLQYGSENSWPVTVKIRDIKGYGIYNKLY